MSAEEHDDLALRCPECGATGTARINTPEHGYAVMQGIDKPYVRSCPDGFTNIRDNDAKFGDDFDRPAGGDGVRVLRRLRAFAV